MMNETKTKKKKADKSKQVPGMQKRYVELGSHGEPRGRHTGVAHIDGGGRVPSSSHALSASSRSACVSGSPRSTASEKRAKNAAIGPVRSAGTTPAISTRTSSSTHTVLVTPITHRKQRGNLKAKKHAVRPSTRILTCPSFAFLKSFFALHFSFQASFFFRDCP